MEHFLRDWIYNEFENWNLLRRFLFNFEYQAKMSMLQLLEFSSEPDISLKSQKKKSHIKFSVSILKFTVDENNFSTFSYILEKRKVSSLDARRENILE